MEAIESPSTTTEESLLLLFIINCYSKQVNRDSGIDIEGGECS